MGGGPDKEDLLVTLPIPKPDDKLAELQRRFPNVQVTYLEIPTKNGREEELKGRLDHSPCRALGAPGLPYGRPFALPNTNTQVQR